MSELDPKWLIEQGIKLLSEVEACYAARIMPSGPPAGLVLLIATIAQICAAIAGVWLMRKRPEHRPMALFLVVVAVANVVSLQIVQVSGMPTSVPELPFTGAERALFHVRQALFLTWSFGMMAMFAAVFASKAKVRVWFYLIAYLGTVAALSYYYPEVRGERLKKAYFFIELAMVFTCGGIFLQWLLQRKSPSATQATAIMLLFCEIGVLVGPWQRDIFTGWDMARVMYAVTYVVLVLIQGAVLWKHSRSS